MPHKHKRKRGDESEFDLPPTQRARPLPTTSSKQATKQSKPPQPPKTRRKDRGKDNDAPRSFRRVMAAARGVKVRSGLDDGVDGKRLVAEPEARRDADTPRIRPGEDLRSFAARVDAALPVSGLAKKGVIKDGKDELGLKVSRTRKERKMHKLYEQWRVEDRKIQEQKQEEQELAAEKEFDNDDALMPESFAPTATTEDGDPVDKKKSRRRNKNDDDPWLELIRKRAEVKVGLHDVAQAPPQLHKRVSKPLQVRGAAVDVDGIPKSAGSLRRREELQAVRSDVVEAYRKIREHEQSKIDKRR